LVSDEEKSYITLTPGHGPDPDDLQPPEGCGEHPETGPKFGRKRFQWDHSLVFKEKKSMNQKLEQTIDIIQI
jgi:hypothetical protein